MEKYFHKKNERILARTRWKKSAENLMKFVYDSWKSVNALNKIIHIHTHVYTKTKIQSDFNVIRELVIRNLIKSNEINKNQ